MQQSFDQDKISFLVGNAEILAQMQGTAAKVPFEETVVEFLNEVSKILMKNPQARQYPDVITLGFWLRKASVLQLKKRFLQKEHGWQCGRGVAFHIAPSNVTVNFAYSLVTGLLSGNANVVRVPSREFVQVEIIAEAIRTVLERYVEIKPYLCLIRYDRDREINDWLSGICDTRIVWGGDGTIQELRKSPLPARSTEITFADRYSLAVIQSDWYLKLRDKEKAALDFYNDTYLSDQNACSSPRVVVWMGAEKEKAKQIFWDHLHALVKEKYAFQPIQAVNKWTSFYLLSARMDGVRLIQGEDNLIVRVKVPQIDANLMELRENSGYFFEYDCEDILEIKALCDDKKCQTIGYLGEKEMLFPLLESGIRGVDRIVPVGKTMDFDLLWDGFDLVTHLTRRIAVF